MFSAIVFLASCAQSASLIDNVPGNDPIPGGLFDGTPFEIQGMVANRMQSCWFAGDPAFTRFTFDLAAHAEKTRAVIRLREGTAAQQLDGTAKTILRADFVAQQMGKKKPPQTKLEYYVLPQDASLTARMRADILRWARGGKVCHSRKK